MHPCISFGCSQESEGAYDKVLAANVVCHHLALQWFGGYVSPATWAQLGVADGLAGLLAYSCMEDAMPELNGRALFQLATTPMGG
jgi:aminopeptidase N